MSDIEATPAASAPPRATTAGGLLRQARQAQGLHIAALAAAIKVVPRKLELLESDQFEQLPDATFTRALAQTVCRQLKVDAAPILALMPPPSGHRLEQVAEGLNTPFRERPGRLVPKEWASVASPVLWLAALLLVATLAVYVLPADWLSFSKSAIARLPGAEAASAPPGGASAVAATATLGAAAGVAEAAAASAAGVAAAAPIARAASDPASAAPLALAATEIDPVAAAAAAGVLQLHASASSWVEVTDARGQSLIARLMQPGENVGLDGVMPLKVRIGNAGATQVTFRGQALELAAFTRDNVARLDLK